MSLTLAAKIEQLNNTFGVATDHNMTWRDLRNFLNSIEEHSKDHEHFFDQSVSVYDQSIDQLYPIAFVEMSQNIGALDGVIDDNNLVMVIAE